MTYPETSLERRQKLLSIPKRQSQTRTRYREKLGSRGNDLATS